MIESTTISVVIIHLLPPSHFLTEVLTVIIDLHASTNITKRQVRNIVGNTEGIIPVTTQADLGQDPIGDMIDRLNVMTQSPDIESTSRRKKMCPQKEAKV